MEGRGRSEASGRARAHDGNPKEGPSQDQDPVSAGGRRELQSEVHNLQVRVSELQAHYEQSQISNIVLESSRGELADLYDFAPIVYLSLDAEGRIQDANLTAATLFGRPRGNLMGKSLAGLVAPRDRALLESHVRRCLSERIRADDELSFSLRGRPNVTAQITSTPIVDREGRSVGCKTVIIDITALKWSHEKLQFLTRASGCLGSLDIEASLAQIARLAVRAFADVAIVDLVLDSGGLRRLEAAFSDERLGDRLRATRTAAPRIHEGTALGRTLRTREPMRFTGLTPAGMARGADHEALLKAAGACSIMYVPILVRGDVCGLFTFAAAASGRQFSPADLSTAVDLAGRAGLAMENARLFEQAQRAIATRQDVLSFVSHDLRNPLMGITLTVENMLRTAPETERRRSASQLQRIRRAAQQMRRMIEDLLDMSAIEGGRLNVQVGVHEASALLEEIGEVFAPTAAAHHIALEIAPTAVPLAIACDRQRLLQVLSNLVDNAIKFTPENGTIAVSVRAEAGMALFVVKDTGSGIPAAVRPHVFEQFRQARDPGRQGRGLGLFISKGLVEAQGGAIWVDSAEGVGTTFSFTLPLAPARTVDGVGRGHDDDDDTGPTRS